ncbi:MAG: glycosyltransferase family 4 protein [Gammaproteobacteria bacterium]|nr:glycosyltransferase family 4 protein [Gammaproteobacteria bacterium]
MKSFHNILLVANYVSDVGYSWHLMEGFWAAIANRFSTDNRKVYLVFPEINEISPILKDAPLEICELDFSLTLGANNSLVKRFIESNKIGYIYITAYPYYHLKYMALKRWGVKKIVHHDHSPGERAKIKGVKRLAKKVILSAPGVTCDLYIGVSKFVRDRLISNGCLPPSKCKYILNGIYPSNVPTGRSDYSRKEFNIPIDDIVIVTTGRASYYKGIDFIINCANYLINTECFNNVSFLFCGDGPDKSKFIELVNELGISKKFIFAGYRRDIPNILKSCDIAFHASEGEAFSLSILEYMDSGCVTVVPDNCGNNEAVVHNKNGFLYPTKDLQVAVNILKKLINDAALREEIASTAQKDVKLFFDINRTEKELVEMLVPVFNATD